MRTTRPDSIETSEQETVIAQARTDCTRDVVDDCFLGIWHALSSSLLRDARINQISVSSSPLPTAEWANRWIARWIGFAVVRAKCLRLAMSAIRTTVLPRVDLPRRVQELVPLLVYFKADREPGESWGDFCHRKGVADLLRFDAEYQSRAKLIEAHI